jgi:hypothetical protein
VGKVPSAVEIQAHEGVAGFQARKVNGSVGLCPGVRLDIRIFAVEELAKPVDGELLHLVYDFAASIVAVSRITFRVFVGEYRTERVKYIIAHEVFRSDEFDAVSLAFLLLLYKFRDLKILFHTMML